MRMKSTLNGLKLTIEFLLGFSILALFYLFIFFKGTQTPYKL